MMSRRALAFAVVLSAALSAACASQSAGGKSEGTGNKVLKGIVVERDREAPGQGGASYAGTGTYYLVFEVKDGEATARYRYQVTYQQWFRFPEGSAVQITLRNNFLTDVKPDR
jgi:hypothetical protein